MDDKIKYLLLAVGAWFLYDWYKGEPATPVGPAGGGTGTGTGTSTGTSTGTGTGTGTGTPPKAVVVTPADAEIAKLAAGGQAAAIVVANQRGLKYNYHQWNWFRQQALGTQQPDPATFTSDPGVAVSATMYLAALPALPRNALITPVQPVVAGRTAAPLTDADVASLAIAGASGYPDGVAAADRAGIRFNYWQWNYYRSLTYYAPPAPEDFTGDPSVLVSASQYIADLTRGLSGLGWAPALPYSTAWSA